MKTKNNVQKTTLKVMAVIISLVLIGFTANAQTFWKTVLENNSLNEIAMVLAAKTGSGDTGDVKTATINTETEMPLQFESWITNTGFFETDMPGTETEHEVPMELENWLTNDTYFGIAAIEIETENALELENWVIDENFGMDNTEAVSKQNSPEQENALELEPWLYANSNWK